MVKTIFDLYKSIDEIKKNNKLNVSKLFETNLKQIKTD